MLTKFAVGQVWAYSTRDHESDSRITIVRLDEDAEYGNIIHIYISDIEIPNADAPGGKITHITHMPYSEEALESSVTELECVTNDLPDYQEGYRLWREDFENSEVGVFDVLVAQAINFVQQSVT